MIDAEFTHGRMSACGRRIAAGSISGTALPAFTLTELTALPGADTSRQRANPELILP